MFCKNCGKKLPDEAKFCNSYRTKVEPVQPVNAEAERPAVNTPPPPVYTNPEQIPPRTPTHRLLAIRSKREANR